VLIVSHRTAPGSVDVDAAIERDRRIALDQSTDFFGTDFSFEIRGRATSTAAWPAWRPERSTARPAEDYLDARQSIVAMHGRSCGSAGQLRFARIENYVKDQVVRRLNYSNIQNVQGIWTAKQLEMTDLRRGSRTRLTLEKLEYNVPLKDEDFTLQAIRRQ
jgi:hypothetical protein